MLQARRLLDKLRNHPSPRRAAHLSLETLEDRAVPAVISGIVYADLNNNGIYNAGEAPIANSSIQLKNAAGTVIGATTTDATGHYLFSTDSTISTAPSSKTVEADLPAALTDSTRSLSVAKFDPSLGTLTSVQLIADTTLTTQATIENLGPGPANVQANVSGTVTLQGPGGLSLTANAQATLSGTAGAFDGTADLQGSSTYESGQKTVPGQQQTVTLSAATQDLSGFVGPGDVSLTANGSATSSTAGPGNLLAMIHTGTSGHVKVVYTYTPSNTLKPGSYTVVQTQQPPGFSDGLDTADNVTAIAGSNKTDIIHVNLVNGSSVNNNFGELPPSALNGVVYRDATHSGAYTPGNPPLARVTVTLSGKDDFGANVTRTARTGGDGTYSFQNLLPGNYRITETQPAGYVTAVNNIGTLGGTVIGDQMRLHLGAGLVGSNYNFGEKLSPAVVPPTVIPPTVVPPTVTPPTLPPPGGLAPIKVILSGGLTGWNWNWS